MKNLISILSLLLILIFSFGCSPKNHHKKKKKANGKLKKGKAIPCPLKDCD